MGRGNIQDRTVLVASSDSANAPLLCAQVAELGWRVLGPYPSNAAAVSSLVAGSPQFALVEVLLSDGPAAPIAHALQGEGVPLVFFGQYDASDRAIRAEVPGTTGLYRRCTVPELLAALEARH